MSTIDSRDGSAIKGTVAFLGYQVHFPTLTSESSQLFWTSVLGNLTPGLVRPLTSWGTYIHKYTTTRGHTRIHII